MTTMVSVCIPTFRRPLGLKRVLSELPGLTGDFLIHAVVADNDAEKTEGLAVCREMIAGGYPLALTAVVAAERGIAQARNVLVETALADGDTQVIAMLDDDSWPAPDWLEVLVALLDRTGAGIAGASIAHAYERAPDTDVEALYSAMRKRSWAEGIVPTLHNTCGLVVRRAVFDAMARPWFQPDYGLAGGEDDDFFLRARDEQQTLAFSPRAVVTEFIPASRATRQFVGRRVFAQGASWTHVRSRRRPIGWSYQKEAAKILAGFAVGAAGYAFLFWSPNHRLAAKCRILRAAGKVNGLMGNLVEVYRATQGQ
jgi:glycosyltransferase involved in cell wall biosynthesis